MDLLAVALDPAREPSIPAGGLASSKPSRPKKSTRGWRTSGSASRAVWCSVMQSTSARWSREYLKARGRPSQRRAMSGHHPVGLLGQRAQPLERRGVLGAVAVDHRRLDRRDVVAADEHAAHGTQIAMPSTVWPSAGWRSSSRSPTSSRPAPAAPGPGRATAARARRSALVEVAQLALRIAGLILQPPGRRLRAAQRRAGEREPAEEVIPVAVRREQSRALAKPAWSSTAGSASSSEGSTGESTTKHSSPQWISVQVVCQIPLTQTTTSGWSAWTSRGRAASPPRGGS